jgi:hypothetical protein
LSAIAVHQNERMGSAMSVSLKQPSDHRHNTHSILSLGIGESEWAFKNDFIVTEEELAAPNVDLVFEGMDTFAAVDVVRFLLTRQT